MNGFNYGSRIGVSFNQMGHYITRVFLCFRSRDPVTGDDVARWCGMDVDTTTGEHFPLVYGGEQSFDFSVVCELINHVVPAITFHLAEEGELY